MTGRKGARALLRTLCCVAALTPIAPALADMSCKGERLALVIGNEIYPDSDTPLTGAVAGAQQVGDALRGVGFEVINGSNLDKAGMDAAVASFKQKIKPGSAVFLYFSGFGMQANGRTYLLPTNAAIWTEKDVAAFGTQIDRLLVEMDEKKVAAEVLVIDAARRNPFERRFRSGGSTGLAVPSTAAANVVVLYSAPPNTAVDAADLPAKPFAEVVASEIAAPHATAQEALIQVRARVQHLSRAGQKPWHFTTMSDDLPLDARDCSRQPGGATPPPRVAERDPPPVTPPPADPSPPTADKETVARPVPDRPVESAKSDPPKLVKPISPRPLDAPRRPDDEREVAIEPSQPLTPPDTKALRFKIVLNDTAMLGEVRDRLLEQNIEPGPDGSEKMREAIRTFEEQAALPAVGKPTLGLLDALRAAPSLQPWGAIVVAPNAATGQPQSWGASFMMTTRAEALASAKEKCKASTCTHHLVFHGDACGAFAMSAKKWIVSEASSVEAARNASLAQCGTGGAACKIIGAVCANKPDAAE